MTIQVSTVPDMGQTAVTTAVTTTDRAAYLTNLLALRSPLTSEMQWLQAIRDRAAIPLQGLAIPSTRNEEWRFTDLSGLLEVPLQAPLLPTRAIAASDLAAFTLPEAATSQLVFVDGVYAPALSNTSGLPTEVFVGALTDDNLPAAIRSQVERSLAQLAGMEEPFTTLNTASLHTGAVVYVPKNQVLDVPIHLLFVATATTPALIQPRIWAIAEQNSSVTLIEDYVALSSGVYFTNSVMEGWVADNAQLHHTRIQRESTAAYHIGKTAITQGNDSRYTCTAFSLGAALSRHNLDIDKQGMQTETVLNGLTMITGQQVADTHSAIVYAQPHSTSQQLHKCIVDDHAHAVFNGKVFVPKAAQMTDASQLSQNLLLSPKGRVDTKPQLEITADNVKCTHGATVSQLDSDGVFYLQSRGIDEVAARKLLVYAFAYEVIGQLPVVSLRDRLANLVRFQAQS